MYGVKQKNIEESFVCSWWYCTQIN